MSLFYTCLYDDKIHVYVIDLLKGMYECFVCSSGIVYYSVYGTGIVSVLYNCTIRSVGSDGLRLT